MVLTRILREYCPFVSSFMPEALQGGDGSAVLRPRDCSDSTKLLNHSRVPPNKPLSLLRVFSGGGLPATTGDKMRAGEKDSQSPSIKAPRPLTDEYHPSATYVSCSISGLALTVEGDPK